MQKTKNQNITQSLLVVTMMSPKMQAVEMMQFSDKRSPDPPPSVQLPQHP